MGNGVLGLALKHRLLVVDLLEIIYALHAFQKKSEQGIATLKMKLS